jgi:diacylglycerol kinase family enzyme
VLIVNPFATAVTDDRVTAVEAALGKAAEVETLFTTRPEHATELAEQACRADECGAIFVFSGDGGFNEALNGADGRVPLGFIPGGGTSVLPRALGLPRDAVAAATQLAAALAVGRTRRISLGRVNGRRFAFNAGLGFDAEVVRRVDALGRTPDGRRPGDPRFAATVLKLLLERRGRFEPALELVGLGRAAFAVVVNCTPYTYAGRFSLRVAREALFETGLDVVAPRRVRARTVPRLLRTVVTGARPGDPELLYAHDLDRIEAVCDLPLPLQVDGEDLGDVERAVFEAERDAVAVLA